MIGIPSGFAGVVVGAECVFLWQQRPGAMAPAMHEDALRGEDAQLSTADSEVNKISEHFRCRTVNIITLPETNIATTNGWLEY